LTIDMKYQLVIQWPASSTLDYDALIEIEEILEEHLSDRIDGHDAGSSEMNIFIHTDDAEKAFDEVREVLSANDFWVDAKAAYREMESEDYVVLWPAGLKTFSIA
ncbi:MAG: hypothetical protein KDM63_00375, partial [Verrucomicrobiae bacterium]|nr:hypothetical protein [Verrucomicrobiae bacterium]